MSRRTLVAPAGQGPAGRSTIYFIRHGETDWNREARLQGQRDIPLNDLGRRQAAEVAGHLRDVLGPRADHLPWLSSPMDRTMETMAIARRTLGLPAEGYRTDDRLREVGFGQWEGLTWKDVRKVSPSGAKARDTNKWGYVPPGGESYQMLLDRVSPVFETLSGETIIVAHGGVARTMLVHLAGVEHLEATMLDIWQGRLLVFEAGGAYWVP